MRAFSVAALAAILAPVCVGGADAQDPPKVPGVVTGGSGNTSIGGCYLTDDGTAYDPGAERTGDSGQWLVAGAAPGGWSLEVAYEFGVDTWESETYPVWAPVDGPAVSPWYPAWVEFAY